MCSTRELGTQHKQHLGMGHEHATLRLNSHSRVEGKPKRYAWQAQSPSITVHRRCTGVTCPGPPTSPQPPQTPTTTTTNPPARRVAETHPHMHTTLTTLSLPSPAEAIPDDHRPRPVVSHGAEASHGCLRRASG